MAGLDQCDQEDKDATNYDIKSSVPKRKEREKTRRLPLTGITGKKKGGGGDRKFSRMAE